MCVCQLIRRQRVSTQVNSWQNVGWMIADSRLVAVLRIRGCLDQKGTDGQVCVLCMASFRKLPPTIHMFSCSWG